MNVNGTVKIFKLEPQNNGKVVKGQLFFASTTKFIYSFDYDEKVECINIDFLNGIVWDESAVDAIDKVVMKYNNNGVKVRLNGLSNKSLHLIKDMSISDMPSELSD